MKCKVKRRDQNKVEVRNGADQEWYIARRRFMNIPKHISVYDIQASIFSLLNKVFPHLNNYKTHLTKSPSSHKNPQTNHFF